MIRKLQVFQLMTVFLYQIQLKLLVNIEELLGSQASLVQKLRDECRHLASQLEKVHTKYK